MSNRSAILDAVSRLIVTSNRLPALDAVAAEAKVTKGGLMHHFPSRAALLDGVVEQELDRVDAVLAEAAGRGHVARTWLELSQPDGALVEVYRAMGIVLKALNSGESTLPETAAAHLDRWDELLLNELGDADQALLIRLVGDGLLLNAVSGTLPAPERVSAIVSRLVGPPQ